MFLYDSINLTCMAIFSIIMPKELFIGIGCNNCL